MPRAHPSTTVISRRNRRRTTEDRHPRGLLARFGIGLASVLSTAVAVLAILLGQYYVELVAGIPSLDSLPVLLGPDGQLRQPTRIADHTGQYKLYEFSNPVASSANYLQLSDVHPDVTNALIAELDPGFWEHNGAAVSYLIDPNPRTLAERLVLDFLLFAEPETPQRALRMRLLATQATQLYGREKILEWFLNAAEFGYNADGWDAAARVYFARPAADLTLAEVAMLAAIAGAPELNPFDAPTLALERQGRVLQAMVTQGFLSPEQALTANQLPISLSPIVPEPAGSPSDFINLVLEQLAPFLPTSRLQRGGLIVISTLDATTQRAAECAGDVQIRRLVGDLPLDSLVGIDCDAARLLPTITAGSVQSGISLEAQIIVLENQTGQVRALVGPSNATHPPGTSLSPFVYLTAFTRGFGPASLLWDVPASLPPDVQGFTNTDGQFHGPLRLRTALANDYVIPALQVLSQIGPLNAWNTARQAGLLSLDTAGGHRLLLDTGEVSLLEVTHAYSLFGNQGFLAGQELDATHLSASTVISVSDSDGRILLDWSQPAQRALTSAQLAYLITDILSDPLARQPSLGRPNPLEVDRPAAAKLGQTSDSRDTWTIGYSPQLTIGIWLGQPDTDTGVPLNPLAAAGLWHAAFRAAHAQLPPQAFLEPGGLLRFTVCTPSGLLPTEHCPEVVEEIFIPGNEPLFADNLYQAIQVNRQTGRLATVFTPPELVETRVFLVFPPFAEEWARAAGIALPPEDYDAVFTTTSTAETTILAPEAFSYVSGQVTIQGRANIPGFSFYRLQIGEGLNPRQWLQIGPDSTTSVPQGQLGVWDTSGLNGLYAVQLLVVDETNAIHTATTQVTVDNLEPQVQILSPSSAQSLQSGISYTLQANAADNIGIASLEFLIDGQSIITLTGLPYAALWTTQPGPHILAVVATDLAGNQSETEIEFMVDE